MTTPKGNPARIVGVTQLMLDVLEDVSADVTGGTQSEYEFAHEFCTIVTKLRRINTIARAEMADLAPAVLATEGVVMTTEPTLSMVLQAITTHIERLGPLLPLPAAGQSTCFGIPMIEWIARAHEMEAQFAQSAMHQTNAYMSGMNAAIEIVATKRNGFEPGPEFALLNGLLGDLEDARRQHKRARGQA